MIKSNCIHPELLSALTQAGHGSKILIADMNFPATTKTPCGEMVWLGYQPGHPNATDILALVLQLTNIEQAWVMRPDTGEHLAHFDEFAELLKPLPIQQLDRHEFYCSAGDADCAVVIVTGENRPYGNILLTMGVA